MFGLKGKWEGRRGSVCVGEMVGGLTLIDATFLCLLGGFKIETNGLEKKKKRWSARAVSSQGICWDVGRIWLGYSFIHVSFFRYYC